MRRLARVGAALIVMLLLTSCSFVSKLLDPGPSDDVYMRDKMAHIIEAINDQDAAALREMFSNYARSRFSEEVDEGVDDLLSLFPNGDLIWRDDGQPSGSGQGALRDGKTNWLGGISDVVRSAGREYTLGFSIFTENEIDPENIGIYRITVDPRSESHVSGAELAGCEPVDPAVPAGGPPGVVIGVGEDLTRDRAAQVVAAINAHDAGALLGMFTDRARTRFAAQVNDGLDYLLSLFPRGDVVIQEGSGGSAVCERIDGDTRTVLLPTFYTVSSAGVDYRLYFADFIENGIDPENVGIYALGASVAAECARCEPEAELNTWGTQFDLEATVRPGVFVPFRFRTDTRMLQLAEALSAGDAAAIKAMFSADVQQNTPELDEGIDYLLSFFHGDELTWALDPAEVSPIWGATNVESGVLTERTEGTYKVSGGDFDLWLFFSDTVENEADPDDVGLQSLGVTPWVEERFTDMPGTSGRFYAWTTTGRYPGIYVP